MQIIIWKSKVENWEQERWNWWKYEDEKTYVNEELLGMVEAIYDYWPDFGYKVVGNKK